MARDPARSVHVRGKVGGKGILCLAGFGDDTSMFEPLMSTDLAAMCRIVTVDLPGFGEEPSARGRSATLADLADFVSDVVASESVEVLLGHSAASIIAGLVAPRPALGVSTVISLEGNLTEADAYFTGLAAEYAEPDAFHRAFLERLEERARSDAVLARYRSRVARADPRALWTLGREVAAYSRRHHPGEALLEARRAHYLYNPSNCPAPTLAWLERSGMPATTLPGASHWPTVDAPGLVARAVLDILT